METIQELERRRDKALKSARRDIIAAGILTTLSIILTIINVVLRLWH